MNGIMGLVQVVNSKFGGKQSVLWGIGKKRMDLRRRFNPSLVHLAFSVVMRFVRKVCFDFTLVFVISI